MICGSLAYGRPNSVQTGAVAGARPRVARDARARSRRARRAARPRAVSVALHRSLDEAAAAAGHGDRDARRRLVAEQALLRIAAERGELLPARGVEAARLRAALGDQARQREVDVVAAEQQVLADRDALEAEPVGAAPHRDQREVGRAAADVDHQHRAVRRELLAPAGMRTDPGVDRRLRLLEQPYARRARPSPPPAP